VLQVLLSGRGAGSPFLFVYPAVVVAAWWGRWEAGAAAIFTGVLGLDYFVLPPTLAFGVSLRRDVIDLAIFCVISVLLVSFIDRTKRALDEARVARKREEAANEARKTMVAIVAHDLRNPMQTLGLNADLLAANLPADDPRLTLPLERLQRSAARARRLVDNIVDAARLEGEPFPLEKAEWPVAAIVDETLSVFDPLAEPRALRLERPSPEAVSGTVVCDRDRVVQVLSNLVGNAFQYTPRGGRVTLDVRRTEDGLRFEVSDTGIGMSKDELAHAFERLWHGPGPGHGSGLGLWIAEALVEAHGSHITATSEVGKGTSMSFVLPSPVRTPAGKREHLAGERELTALRESPAYP
jgi:signal transduction histidine kinase